MLKSRIFNRPAAVGGCCGDAGAEIPAIEYGGPPAVIAPAPAGTVIPAPPSAIEQLEPIGPGETSRKTTNGTSTSMVRPFGGSYRPTIAGTSRSENFARSVISSEPARRPAPQVALPQSSHPLDNLPPLVLPMDPNRDRDEATATATASANTSAPGIPPEAETLLRKDPEPPAEITPPVHADSIAPPQVEVSQAPTAPAPPSAQVEPAPEPELAPEPAAEAALSVAPGLRRFEGVEPELAAGSLPTDVGLDWLADKGYRTLLDLREPGPDQPMFIAEAMRRGFRYLPLPIAAGSINADLVARFNAELDQPSARPLYFFDEKGDRAGALWYIRRMTVDRLKVDETTASREAKDLGLEDQTFWHAAVSYLNSLDSVKAPSQPATEPAPAAAPAPSAPDLSTPAPAPAAAAATPAALPPVVKNPTPVPGGLSLAQTFGISFPEETSRPKRRDPGGWKSYAALIVTSLGVPLAYWSRSLFSLGRLTRASLPAPKRRPKSLPGGSDV